MDANVLSLGWPQLPKIVGFVLQIEVTTAFTIKFLNFRTPENFAVIYLKFKQRSQILGYFI